MTTANSVCSKITKGTTPPKAAVVVSGGIPFLRVNNLTFEGRLNDDSEIVFISETSHRGFLARSVAYPGDVVMNIVGPPLGKIALLPDRFAEYNLNQAIVIYRTRSTEVDRRFFLAYLGCGVAQQWLQLRSKKTSGQQNLTIELCKQLPVLLPPLDEQKTIATILATWDTAIETIDHLIANGETQKSALMQYLLSGKVRTGGSKQAWQSRLLGNLFTERVETNRPDLSLLSITASNGVIPQSEVGRKNSSNEDKAKYKRICPGDIGYNTMRMWQGVSALSFAEGIVSPAYTVVKSKGEIDPLFASYLFKLPQMIHKFRQHSQGLTSDTWNLKFPNFARIEVTLPALEEQKRIAEVLSNADRLIQSSRAHREVLMEEKAALVQQLVTGKYRVDGNG